jgi:hypothetical protein
MTRSGYKTAMKSKNALKYKNENKLDGGKMYFGGGFSPLSSADRDRTQFEESVIATKRMKNRRDFKDANNE